MPDPALLNLNANAYRVYWAPQPRAPIKALVTIDGTTPNFFVGIWDLYIPQAGGTPFSGNIPNLGLMAPGFGWILQFLAISSGQDVTVNIFEKPEAISGNQQTLDSFTLTTAGGLMSYTSLPIAADYVSVQVVRTSGSTVVEFHGQIVAIG